MDTVKLSLAYINLNLTTNKIMFRKKYEPKKSDELDKQINDLDQVRLTLLELENENRALSKKMWELQEENLKLTQMTNDLKLIIDL